MSSTKDVVGHHLKSFGEGDLNGILSDYAPMAILFTPDGPLEGVDTIRPLFRSLLAEFAKPGSSFKLKHQSIKGDYAYILWTAETPDNSYELATDTFVVQGGKIVAQTFAAKILPKDLRSRLPATKPLHLASNAGLVLGWWASVSSTKGK